MSLENTNQIRNKDKASKRQKKSMQSKELLDLIVLISTIESVLLFSFGIMSS